jgi:mannose-6-phosphate isomerase
LINFRLSTFVKEQIVDERSTQPDLSKPSPPGIFMNIDSQNEALDAVRTCASEMTRWLVDKALPRWSAAGLVPRDGSCFESIDLASLQGLPGPRRARIVPRQIYSFLEGVQLGWKGAGDEIATNLHAWYVETYLTRDGHFAASAGMENRIVDPTFDLYNQAFSLFGFATIAASLPELRANAEEQAANLLNHLVETYAHPEAGFREAVPDRLPLCSNPHMHLFEACLAWETVSEDSVWSDLSDEIAELALARFIDPVSGGLREFFNADWSPFSGDGDTGKGRIMEPGHQFEWAWLLARWGRKRGDATALVAARRLYDIGWTYGIDESRGVTFMALNDDFTVRDPVARLWGQTEWIKAAIALARISTDAEREAYLADIPDAVRALELFLEAAPDGLWRDKMAPDGSFVNEPAPASSLYHIVCAISELDSFAKTL